MQGGHWRGLAVGLIAAALFVRGASGQVWEAGPALPGAIDSRPHAVGINDGGTLYAIGGPPWTNGGDEDGSVHRLLPGASAWDAVSPLGGVGPFLFQGGGVDALGRIVIFGGELAEDPEENPPSPFVYEPVDGPGGGLADRSASAPYGRFAWCTDAQGRIYSLGGGPGAGGANSAFCERYDGAADAWEVIAPMLSPVADGAAAADVVGRVLVFGGYNASGAARTANVAVYDIATDTWSDTLAPDMPEALSGARGVVGADGRFYVIGGESGPVGAGVVRNTCYVLESDLSAWSVGPAMTDARRWFAAALGDDDFIYVLGGDDGAGGVASCEKLRTIPCPEFVIQPADQAAWSGSVAGFHARADGGGVITYAWFRDGAALSDGPTMSGSVVGGSGTASLRILAPGVDDEGVYSVVATNSCGSAESSVATLTVREPIALPTSWRVVNLHPGWAQSSTTSGVSGGIVSGTATTIHPTYGSMPQAVAWMSESSAAINLTPGNSVGSQANDIGGGVIVGWWWRPYSCQGGTCYFKVAAKWTWTGAGWQHTDIHSWPEYDYANATDGTTHTGYSWSDEPTITWKGVIWRPTGGYTEMRDGDVKGVGGAVSDGVVYGYLIDGGTHAARWTHTPSRAVDLHPDGAMSSSVLGAGDDQQVGSASVGGMTRAWLWAGVPGAWVDLTPVGATFGEARGCEGGLQAGRATIDGVGRAVVWRGDAGEIVDLHALSPPEYSTTIATGIDIGHDGVVRVSGYGYDVNESRFEALFWIGGEQCTGDTNGDGVVDFSDLNRVLSGFGQVGAGLPGDADGDGDVDFSDLNAVLSAFGSSCSSN